MKIGDYNRSVKDKITFLYGEGSERTLRKINGRRMLFVAALPLMIATAVLALMMGQNLLNSVLAGVLLIMSAVAFFEYRIFDKAKKKRRKMRFELSDITERAAILLEAGVPLWNAFAILAENADEAKPLELELKRTVASFVTESGYYYEPERAFQEMAGRCGDSAVSTFVSLVIQNSRKGGGELASLLRLQAVNQRTERRAIAKQLADEASTLMVIPSVMVLAAIMAIVAAPAVIQFLKI